MTLPWAAAAGWGAAVEEAAVEEAAAVAARAASCMRSYVREITRSCLWTSCPMSPSTEAATLLGWLGAAALLLLLLLLVAVTT